VILDLLLKEEFPQVRLPPSESHEVLLLLRYRHRLVRMRTQVKNSLRALALSAAWSSRCGSSAGAGVALQEIR
jgi:transposase